MNSYETRGQSHLAKQSLNNTVYKYIVILNNIFFNIFQNFDLLTPLTHEVISRQATINIGTIGHVAHGKSTLVKSLSGVDTGKFRKEKEKNLTIKLGYANAKVNNFVL